MSLIRFKALIYREVIRFLKVINQTILSPAISSFLYLAVFGFVLGSQVSSIGPVTYMQFIIPGIMVMEVMMAAFSNTSSSLFLSRYLHMIDHILVTPVTYTELVLAYIIGSIFRGVLVGLLIWGVSLFFSPFKLEHFFAFAFFITTISIVFSGVGLVVALWSEEFEDLSIVTTYIITPFTFLGGVFYSLKMLPAIIYKITIFNPFFYMIDAFRWSMIGYAEGNILISIVLLSGLSVFVILFNIYLFKKGYKLKQ
ncbi:MAG: ABC transporter permease [Candidatus Margulisbacteria bacterium]|nr:ABC transporter permease [Candidatus Margulisiibacteriota bacterium]